VHVTWGLSVGEARRAGASNGGRQGLLEPATAHLPALGGAPVAAAAAAAAAAGLGLRAGSRPCHHGSSRHALALALALDEDEPVEVEVSTAFSSTVSDRPLLLASSPLMVPKVELNERRSLRSHHTRFRLQ
jgi:hypothetical protein